MVTQLLVPAEPRRSVDGRIPMDYSLPIGHCDHCGGEFPYFLAHNGFNQSSYAYCDECGLVAFFDRFSDDIPSDVVIDNHHSLPPNAEDLVAQCECGGRFRSDSAPRCPICKSKLSAEIARQYIEDNAPGTKRGFRWQCNWTGMYTMLVNNHFVEGRWTDRSTEP